MKITKRQARVNWILEHTEEIKQSREKYKCPEKCKASCGNGATCFTSSGGGWGFWAQAFRIAKIRAEIMSYWSGSNPTPSTSISKGIAEYIYKNVPKEIL